MISSKTKYILFLLAAAFSVLVWSVIDPKDYHTWVLEVAPGIIAFIILAFTYKKFPLTNLAYTLIAIHAIILFIGGHYTYAEVPLFDHIKEFFHTKRNDYDKVGHFAQGFIPAIVIREILLRKTELKPSKILFTIIVLCCFGISAIYELIEWADAEIEGGAADDFLGLQGDIWDTQKDMLFCGVGAITSLLLLSKPHNKQLRALKK